MTSERTGIGFGGICLLLVAFGLPGLTDAGQTPPSKVMSLNLCGDVLLLHLAERKQIASLTFLAASSPLSPVREQARGLPVNYGSAEEVVALDPDLVLVHRYSAFGLVKALEDMGYPLWRIDSPSTISEAAAQLAALGKRLGQDQRGNAESDRLLNLPRHSNTEVRPVAAVYGPNGMTASPGSLLHDLMQHAGLRNFADIYSLPGTGRIPLELLVQNPPDALILSGNPHAPGNTLAQQTLQHPALNLLANQRPVTHIPGEFWSCGGPEISAALERLHELRQSLVNRMTADDF